jgi:gentisate 1,2-dioxygenase
MRGVWDREAAAPSPDPRTSVKPHIWRWAEVYDGLLQVRDGIGIEGIGVERRTILLVNPGLQERMATTHTMVFSVQTIKPGEVAPPHRHTIAAILFILEGKGASTTVGGERIVWEEGDLILTPQWAWHEHKNESDKPVVWLNGADVPLIQSLQVSFFEAHSEKQPPLKKRQHTSHHYSLTRPLTLQTEKLSRPLHYRWGETYYSLELLAERDPHPFEGFALEYVNPLSGTSTLPTLSCWLQMLRPGTSTQVHRHTSTSLYHVFRGSGTTFINGQPFHWEQGDSFVVPLWHWHGHSNRSLKEDAILFSMHDTPIFKALELYREESYEETG